MEAVSTALLALAASVRVVQGLEWDWTKRRLCFKTRAMKQVGSQYFARNGDAFLRTRTAARRHTHWYACQPGTCRRELERRYGNHLLVPVSINNRRGA